MILTPKAAELKIKAHLKRVNQRETVVITPRLVSYWWKVLNIAVFQNELYIPNIKIVKQISGEAFGECVGCELSAADLEDYEDCDEYEDRIARYVIIKIQSELSSRRLFLNVLVHEMVHQWEWETYKNMGHSKRFFQWHDPIKKSTGLVLKKLYDRI